MAYKKILIAIDNGPTSEKVAQSGFGLALQLKSEEIALMSVVDTEFLLTDGGVTPKQMTEMIKNDYTKNQKMITDKIFMRRNVWSFVEEGKPYEMILKTADEWDADVIVLGTHGRTAIKHLVMGSVAEKVIRHSVKPVFIIPTK